MRRMILCFFVCMASSSLFAQGILESNSLSSANLGSLSFYLDKKMPNTQGESIHVVEKSKAYFCLQLNRQVPALDEAVRHLRQVTVLLEGEGEAPQHIEAKSKLRKGLLYPNSQSCFVGELLVPQGLPAGKYHVSELDLLLASRHVLSFRDRLSQLNPLGLVELSSPIKDSTSPLVEKIESWVPLEDEMNMRYHRAWADIHLRVTATDQTVGIDPHSFQLFFKATLDDELVDIVQAKCSTILPNLYYNCDLYFSRAEPDFRGRTLKLVIDSVSVADKLGNLTELNTPHELEKLFGGKLLRYTFYSKKVTSPNGKISESQASSKEEREENSHTESPSKPKSVLINKRRDRF